MSATINNGTWYHIIAVFDSVSGVHHVYLNGVDHSNSLGRLPFQQRSLFTAANWGQLERDSGEIFPGQIDDVRVYNRALSAAEISQLYHYGQSGGLGDVSGNCSNPSMPEGSLFYNLDYNVMQYCNGEQWIGIGK